MKAAATLFLRGANYGKSHKQERKTKAGRFGVQLCWEYGVTMTIEDMFADMNDLWAEGVEILANAHIKGYPEPTDEWVENWFRLLAKYNIKPVEYGHWVDSRKFPGRELTTRESYNMLIRDIKLAHLLGFKRLRT